MVTLLARYNKSQNTSKKISDSFCIYNSKDFANIPRKIARPNKSGYALIKVIGTSLPRLSDWTIEFTGEWKQSNKYGYTFFAETHRLIRPSTERGIERFLCSKSFPGIGEKTAKAIVKEFGVQTLEIIEKNPSLLLRVDGINFDKIKIISDCYKKDIALSKLCSYLSTYGISQNIAIKIKDRYGDNSIAIIKENPYMIQSVHGIGFLTCEKIARSENVCLNSYIRIQGAMIETLKTFCESTGNMFMKYEEFKEKALLVLNNEFIKQVVSDEDFKSAVKRAHEQQVIVFVDSKYVYLKEYYDAEDYSARKLAYLLKNNTYEQDKNIEEKLNNYIENSSIKLTLKQNQAVKNTLKSSVSIITGGPGTGKTTILKAIIDVYKAFHPDRQITLLAPTGKAATRMTLSSGYVASTIHSKLNIYEDYEATNVQIEKGLIVVDEASMLDNLLLSKLLKAIQNESQIVFVGDINQLPSVGAGAVLHDMISSNCIMLSELSEVFRQEEGGTIVENANLINLGSSSIKCDETFEIVEVEDEQDALNKIKTSYADECKKYGLENVALLSPLRRNQSGRFVCVSDSLNSEIQNAINPPSGVSIVCNNTEFRLNDRVLQWRNTKEIANGDAGVITDLGQNETGIFVKIAWDNKKETVETRESLNDITLAYAMSVHKSQGSEYDSVIIPMLSNQICRLFKRNLLYTAITRAKKHVTIITDKENKAISYCVKNSEANKRNTLLDLRIRKYCKLQT